MHCRKWNWFDFPKSKPVVSFSVKGAVVNENTDIVYSLVFPLIYIEFT